jgi:hypothetical protein
MKKRQIALPDGRYLIFYTFDARPAPRAAEEKHDADKKSPEVEPEPEEERRV